MMTREEARRWAISTLNDLSLHFEIKPPSFRFNRGSHGLYYSGRREVTTAPPERYSGGRSIEHSLVHEFAHHLADERNREAVATARALGKSWMHLPLYAHHGPAFRKALLEVATKFYGDPAKYPWDTEYPAIKKWAEERGLIASKPPQVWRFGNRIYPKPSMTLVQPVMSFDMGASGGDKTVTIPLQTIEITIPGTPVVEPVKPTRYDAFDAKRAVELYGQRYSISMIARELANGRALGHTRNRVREALRAAGVYKEAQ
jgi:hypothetical protein